MQILNYSEQGHPITGFRLNDEVRSFERERVAKWYRRNNYKYQKKSKPKEIESTPLQQRGL
jgi:hypothetical protein